MKKYLKQILGNDERRWATLKKPKFILQGIATYLPKSFATYLPQHQKQFIGLGVRESDENSPRDTARACYAVWLRFLVHLHDNPSFDFSLIKSVGEIGPGDSLGIGFAAILSGATSYHAFDVVPTAYNRTNEDVLDEMIRLFQQRTKIPDEAEFPKCYPKLPSYEFPSHILTEEILRNSLAPQRIAEMRMALTELKNSGRTSGNMALRYYAPWTEAQTPEGAIDLLVSNATLEHVDYLEDTYRMTARIVRTGGWCAHTIGLDSHGTASLWNGYWTYADATWKVIRGRSVYFINREPTSSHVRLLEKYHFRVTLKDCHKRVSVLRRSDLSKRFAYVTDEDFDIYSVFIIAQKA